MTTLYGIKNCDTMKKAMNWLKDNGIAFSFHDYKKLGVDQGVLKQAIAEHGWESIINRRGTTWKKLPHAIRDNMSDAAALTIANENPSVIKRPLFLHEGKTFLGFDDQACRDIFNRPE